MILSNDGIAKRAVVTDTYLVERIDVLSELEVLP